jgi:serine/threonine protein kinase
MSEIEAFDTARAEASQLARGRARKNVMEAQRWAMIDSLYHAALTKEPGERSSFLAAVCAEDAELRREVESLLAHAGAHFSIPRQRSNMAKLARNIAGDGVNPELLWRFEQESQALGRLQHPGIAQIYEAGTADTGFGPQPYFAMEFIRGESLGEYAEAHQLNTRQRLAMMTKICEAVRHAHQRGLIHRDLKPGNMIRALPVRKNRFLSRIRTNDPTSKGR